MSEWVSVLTECVCSSQNNTINVLAFLLSFKMKNESGDIHETLALAAKT